MDDLDFIEDQDEIEDLDFPIDPYDDMLSEEPEWIDDSDDCILDQEFIDSHLNIIPCELLHNFPFVEDDVDAITDYELFSKGFGYLDDKKADKSEIPDVSQYVTKDTNELENYPLTDTLSSVAFSGDYDDLTNKPVIPDVSQYVTKDTTELENYPLTTSLSNVAFSGDYDDLSDKPTIPDVSNFITKDVNDLTYYTKTSDLATVATTGDYDDLIDKPTIPDVSNFITKDVNDLTYYTKTSDLATVATTGDYDDLIDKPTIPDVSNFITKDVNNLTYYTKTSDLATVATTGDYDDLIDKPTIPDVSNFITKDVNNLTYYTTTSALTTLLSGKEDVVEYGSNTNGNYFKFASGLLICTASQNVTTAINSAWGVLYESSAAIDLGSFPYQFISVPVINATIGSQRSAFVESIYSTTASSWGYTYLVRPNSATSSTYQIDLIAIGKWK